MDNGMETDVRTLRSEMAQLRDDFAKISGTMQEMMHHGGANAAQGVLHSAEQVQESLKRTTRGVVEEVKERPVTAALAALSIGMVLGMLFSARRG